MVRFPFTVEKHNDEIYFVSFVDLPELNTVGITATEATAKARCELPRVLNNYFSRKRLIPIPTLPVDDDENGEFCLHLNVIQSIKVLLCNEFVKKQLRKVDIQRRTQLLPAAVDRIFDLNHTSKLETVEQVAKALGRHVIVTI